MHLIFTAAALAAAILFPQEALAQATSAGLPHDLSPWSMFLAADWVVKGVMILLAVASVASWAIFVAKLLEISSAGRRVRKTMQALSGSRTLTEAKGRIAMLKGPGQILLKEAVAELELADHGSTPEGIKERVQGRLAAIEIATGERLAHGLGFLATVGSIAPFVGLFGTVWGIMNSFVGIAASRTTNLAVVAPGIAEALLATAIGLVAAIPAVVFYNRVAKSVSIHRNRIADVSAEMVRILSRDLERGSRRPLAVAAE